MLWKQIQPNIRHARHRPVICSRDKARLNWCNSLHLFDRLNCLRAAGFRLYRNKRERVCLFVIVYTVSEKLM
jgi:hypothetical protein